MADFMDSALIAVIILAGGTVVCRLFPQIIGVTVEKRIEHRYEVALARIKGELDAKYATLTTSVDYLSSGQSEYRSRAISSVEALWNTLIKIDDELGVLGFVDNILLPEELETFFSVGDEKAKPILGKFRTLTFLEEGLLVSIPHQHRLFCGERLWLLFSVYFAIHGRMAILINKSFNKKKYIYWKNDKLTKRHLEGVLSSEVLDEVYQMKVGGFSSITGYLKAEFLKEAIRVMSGSQQLADSLSDLRATLLLEKDDLLEDPE